MRVSYDEVSKQFIVTCSYEEKDIAKRAGFFWDYTKKKWVTSDYQKAARLRDYFDDSVKRKINSVSLIKSPWAGSLPIPQGKKLDPYQVDGVKFSLTRNNSYLAFEQGLGKTPMSAVIANAVFKKYLYLSRVLIVVPPFLISNWLRELENWNATNMPVTAIRTSKDLEDWNGPLGVTIFPDSLLSSKVLKLLTIYSFDLLIVDEAHRHNNSKSKRSSALIGEHGIADSCEKVVLLSGTPMRNRPIELYACLSRFASNLISFRGYYSYANKFCDARYIQISKSKKVFDVSGASNVPELREDIKDFMKIERAKDHLDLKWSERIVMLDGKLNKNVKKLEKSLLSKHKLSDLISNNSLGEIATYRTMLSKIKLKPASDYIENILEYSDQSIIVFAWHTDLILGLHDSLSKYKPLLIYGGVRTKDRDEIEKKFQNKKSRLLIANIQTMVGLNLTSGTRGIFVESSWVPADNDQAKKRMIRRGQKENVSIEHLVIADTLDEYVLRRVLEKQDTINELTGE